MISKKVLVSGCYDLIHGGHVAFFKTAASYGNLLVSVGKDENLFKLKGKRPLFSEQERLPSHSSHTHTDEVIILVRFGRVEESINGKPFQCGPGSAIFLTNDDDHGVRNVGEGPCEYYAIRWLTY